MNLVTRRTALTSAAVSFLTMPTRAHSVDIERISPHFKLSLAAYSFRRQLDLKKSPVDQMNLHQFAVIAAEWGLGAIELTSYYVSETTPEWFRDFKRHCHKLGLTISGTAVRNDFCNVDAGKRAADVTHVKRWIEHSAYLGAATIRVFAGILPKGEEEDAARKRCVECLKNVADHGARHGVFVAVENHHGITSTPDQLLAIVNGVKHEWCGVNLDTGNFNTADPYADLAKVADRAVVVQLKTEIHPAGKPKQEADLDRLLTILGNAKYRGFVALEYEAAEDPAKAVPRYLKLLQSKFNEIDR